MNTFLLGPDLGDCLAACAIVKHLGGGHVRLFNTPGTKGFHGPRYDAIKSIIEIQPWCKSIAMFDEKEDLKITHDVTGFRERFNDGDSLIEKQARWLGLPHNSVDLSPWITIPDVHRHGKIVLCRSQRCLGSLHWFRFFYKHKECIFLGVQEDYDQFCAENSPWMPHKKNMPKIEFRKTENLLEAAMLIKGARLFVCNQTALLWIGMATGCSPMLVEKVNDDSCIPMAGRRYVASAQENPSAREFQKL